MEEHFQGKTAGRRIEKKGPKVHGGENEMRRGVLREE